MRSATVEHTVEIKGPGMFTGEECRAVLAPGDAGSGIVFVQNGVDIPATPESFIDQPKCTVLGNGKARVAVTEHLLFALWVNGIDTVRISVEGPEVPNSDGSALMFHRSLYGAGRCELGERPSLSLAAPIKVTNGSGAYIELIPGEGLSIEFHFEHPEIGAQEFSGEVTRSWAADNLVRARTFITDTEAEAAQQAGLIGHRDESAALVVRGGVPVRELYWPDEFVRHKVVDLLGDLYVLPMELTGKIVAYKSGHALNRDLAKGILAVIGDS